MPSGSEIGRDQPGAEARRRKARGRIAVVEPAIGRAGRIGRPVRRPEPLHPAALLVDQDGRIGAQFMQSFINKASDLRLIFNVSLEQDQAPRPGLAQERALIGGQVPARKAR